MSKSPQSQPAPSPREKHYDVIVIGTGFGGSMTGLALARKFPDKKILMLERGTWWTTPVGTVQDKEVATAQFLHKNGQPYQYWATVDHFKGLLDLVTRCVRRPKNEDGLYDLTNFGRPGFLGLIGGEDDRVSVLRANGVGGGSLVYANVTIQPPDFIFEETRWAAVKWDKPTRDNYYDLARDAIGFGVVSALNDRQPDGPDGKPRSLTSQVTPTLPKDNPALAAQIDQIKKLRSNTGLSNIVMRSARLEPGWQEVLIAGRKIRRVDPDKLYDPVPGAPERLSGRYALWLDRARVFQVAASKITHDYGTVDSSINDVTPEPNPLSPDQVGKNYCERQGRCIIGCLPGARHTLNKQLMRAIVGAPALNNDVEKPPLFPNMELVALAEVEYIEETRPTGGYTLHYWRRNARKPWEKSNETLTADRVIVAAGCVGTNEIMWRSKVNGNLSDLSDKLGYGFSTNGDYLAFLDKTDERVNLGRGPVTTSFAHFNTPDADANSNPAHFHTIEDNGLPRVFSSLAGVGIPLARAVTKGRVKKTRLFVVLAILRWLFRRFLPQWLSSIGKNADVRQKLFQSEDEYTANMMCIAAIGRDAAVGQFRLGQAGETPLRVSRDDTGDGIKEFYQDPIYAEIEDSLKKFAQKLSKRGDARFINPFAKLGTLRDGGLDAPIVLSHPLGGCRIAENVSEGVVDEYGRVFNKSKTGDHPFYKGLYIADAAVIPTSLGVNPSLTISAVALRIADKIVEEMSAP